MIDYLHYRMKCHLIQQKSLEMLEFRFLVSQKYISAKLGAAPMMEAQEQGGP
jgi:hypothetical protein